MPDTISESYKLIEDGSLFMVRKLLFSPFLESRIVNHSYTLNKRLTRKLLRWRWSKMKFWWRWTNLGIPALRTETSANSSSSRSRKLAWSSRSNCVWLDLLGLLSWLFTPQVMLSWGHSISSDVSPLTWSRLSGSSREKNSWTFISWINRRGLAFSLLTDLNSWERKV